MKVIQACLGVLLDVCAFSRVYVDFLFDIQVNQSAKGEISNFDTVVTWLGSIENFIGRLGVYSDKILPPAMVEMVVKIMVELISTLALVTKILKGRKRGVFVLADVFSYSAPRCRQS